MFAVIRTGGKQYKVTEGETLDIELVDFPAEGAKKITISDVLLVGGDEGKDPRGGSGISVKATVLGPIRTKKVLVFKKKRRKQYRRTKGHRQTMLQVRIDGIEG